ncbi:MAG: HPr(Ser) kinase/phosphatase [Candidatus Competibacteraceae bacterium]|nr:HPr(Ser) kinase/phosphatase [Candidatus Competibacteraceae bacterium]MBK7982765.1 HPr(Ser) kinase/phosphatase [Candidatus Competibacteraceae bacterium]MBK8898688.1 HPr(Ser) kinase/phosphatase [Candidatus Competibacteraceae bacterium]MBK8962488.1 HPr(Ser) kinase/phosphatase [Candidatus Competibacteraceae bacterium]MBK9951704.1 HPr(Ser) kinase/phosphatase [Candidatus Competibacteraceae bacterium]
MNQPVQAQTVFQRLEVLIDVSWVGGAAGAVRTLWPAAGDLPLFGRLNWVQAPRLQIIGSEDCCFLDRLEPAVRESLLRRLLEPPAGAVLICGDPEQAEALRGLADAFGTPLWHTSVAPAVVVEQLSHYQHELDASTVLHGELLEVFGMGVLITGASGVGKSELALELISRGHRLIADDTPTLTRVAPNVLEGTCSPTLRDLLEVRGLGILNIRRMFGDSAIKRNKRVRLIIELVKLEEIRAIPESRLQGLRANRVILGIGVPTITLPIAPGRNLAVLVECAVRDHILRLSGYRAEEDLMTRMQKAMAEAVPCE